MTRGRSLWIVADQCLSSSTNIVLIVLVARATDAASFGNFSLLISAYYIGLGLSSALAGEACLILRLPERDRLGVRQGLGSATLMGVALSGVFLILGPALGFSFAVSAVLAACMPFLMLQDALRYYCFASGTAFTAAVADAFWLVALVAAYWWLPKETLGSTGAWAVSGALSALLLLVATRCPPQLGIAPYLRRYAATVSDLVLDGVLVLISAQALLYATAWLVGLEEAGGLRTLATVFGPLNVGFGALRVAVIRKMQRRRSKERANLSIVASIALGTVVVIYIIILTSLPLRAGSALFGASWRVANPLIVSYGAIYLALAGSFGPVCMLKAMAVTRPAVIVRAITASGTLLGAVLGSIVGDARGGVIGCAAAAAIGLCMLVALASRESRREETVSDFATIHS